MSSQVFNLRKVSRSSAGGKGQTRSSERLAVWLSAVFLRWSRPGRAPVVAGIVPTELRALGEPFSQDLDQRLVEDRP